MTTLAVHVQCELERLGAKQVSWIPSPFAEIGRYVRLKEAGLWQNGWRVIKVSNATRPSSEVESRKNDHKAHRKATDI